MKRLYYVHTHVGTFETWAETPKKGNRKHPLSAIRPWVRRKVVRHLVLGGCRGVVQEGRRTPAARACAPSVVVYYPPNGEEEQ